MIMMVWDAAKRFAARVSIGLLTACLAMPAAASRTVQTAYFPILGTNTSGGMLIDWQSTGRARVVNTVGAQSGTVTRDGDLLVVTFDSPISGNELDFVLDSCGTQPMQRRDTSQIVLRDVRGNARRGVSQVIEIGTLTTLEGCDAGKVLPFGARSDPGVEMNRLLMDARPSTRDLLPGTQIAGFSEEDLPPSSTTVVGADIVTLYAGGMALFSATGHVVPAQFDAEQWLVFTFPGSTRAYARLEIDGASGIETWLRADWSNGQPQRVVAELVVKPNASAGFGTERQAARMWEGGLVAKTQLPFLIHLYAGGTGERINKDLDAGTESRSPITWSFVGKNIRQTRIDSTSRRDRIWVPLRSQGKVRVVLESETRTRNDGSISPFIAPRINFYIDTGKAVAPSPSLVPATVGVQ